MSHLNTKDYKRPEAEVRSMLNSRRDGRISIRVDLVGFDFRDLRALAQLLRGVEFSDVAYRRDAEAVAIRVGREIDDRLATWSPF